MQRALVALLLVASSCKRAPPPPAPPPPATVAAAAIDAAPSPSVAADADVDPNLDVKAIAKAWNEAINARDLAGLTALHAPNVRFYGVNVDQAMYGAKMKAALDKDPSFHQTIDSLRVERPRPGVAKIWFRKNDNKAEHAAYLVLAQAADGSWRIEEESDFVTDANLKCQKSERVTVTGTLDEGSFGWHDQFTPTTVIVLAKPICVERSEGDDWGGDGSNRMDDVEGITFATADPKLPRGTKVRVTGTHLQPHFGSGYYSTPLLMFVESVTRL